MAGQRRTQRTSARRTAGFGLAVLVLASGCTTAHKPVDPTVDEIQQTLDARGEAVVEGDRTGYLAALDPGAAALRKQQGREFDNMADIPFDAWEYRIRGVRHQGARAVADTELRYRVDGYDSAPVTADRTLELTERDGRWYVTADEPGTGAPQQLWQQGDVRAVRGSRSLVLGVGQDDKRLRELAAAADRAVPAVMDAWPSKWVGRVVVLVPSSVESMGRLLGAPAAGYRGIAAVTTGETGRKDGTTADRVIVNPEAYGLLGDFGRGIVLTHETTHVATRADTSAATPMWLSEGFADWVAYRGTGRTAAETAPELRDAVSGGEVPVALPDDEGFAFGGDADALARAYEGGWLACEMVADRWGEDALREFYRTVGASEHREGAVERALGEVLGITADEFTARWQDYLRERLG
ncbi:hypothetical protein ACF08N_13580 [Streptomyces sp. NPDC015127]|uniref:hypothetical protein n=1 Tax=Streptomyces sp. NPDC015127 TaxID=3364939 RepID=UPI0036FE8184